MTPHDEQQERLQSTNPDSIREQDKIHLVLSYLGCLCLIPYLTVKDSPFVTWHAKQGLVLFGLEVVVTLVLGIVLSFIGGTCLASLLDLGLLGVSLIAIVRALKGERWRLPVVADLADKL